MIFIRIINYTFLLYKISISLFNKKYQKFVYFVFFIVFFSPSVTFLDDGLADSLLEEEQQNIKKTINYKQVLLYGVGVILALALFYYLISTENSNFSSLDNLTILGTLSGDKLINNSIPYVQLDCIKNIIHYSNYSLNELFNLDPSTTIAIIEYSSKMDLVEDLSENIYNLVTAEELIQYLVNNNFQQSSHF